MVRRNAEDDQYLKLPKSLLTLLWSILVSLVGVWWHGQKQQTELRLTVAELSATVRVLSETVTRTESRHERYYLNTDASKDLGMITRQLDDHESRLRRVEQHK